MDTFRDSKAPQYPFQTLFPSAEIPLDLPPDLQVLDRLYSQLSALKLADAFKKSYINAALLLNRLLQVPVFSFVSNDDGLDFTCSASNGVLSRLRCRCDDLMITFSENKVQIAPLIPEDAEDDDLFTDTAALTAVLPDVE